MDTNQLTSILSPEIIIEFKSSPVKYISLLFLSTIALFSSINFSSYYLNSKYGIGSMKNTDILFKIIIFFFCVIFCFLVASFYWKINYFDYVYFPISSGIHGTIILIIGLMLYDLLLVEIPTKLDKPTTSIGYSEVTEEKDIIEYSMLLDKYGKNIPLSRIKEVKEKSTNVEETVLNKTKNNSIDTRSKYSADGKYSLIAFIVSIIYYFVFIVDWNSGISIFEFILLLLRCLLFAVFWTFIFYLPYSMIFKFRKLSELRSVQLLGLLNLVVITGFVVIIYYFLLLLYVDSYYINMELKPVVRVLWLGINIIFFISIGILYKLKMEKFK